MADELVYQLTWYEGVFPEVTRMNHWEVMTDPDEYGFVSAKVYSDKKEAENDLIALKMFLRLHTTFVREDFRVLHEILC